MRKAMKGIVCVRVRVRVHMGVLPGCRGYFVSFINDHAKFVRMFPTLPEIFPICSLIYLSCIAFALPP